MLFFSKINFLSSQVINKPGFFLLQDTMYTEISAKKKTKFVLNRSPHVHKKSKERFTFFWPRRFTYTTPTFSDTFSLNSFISLFFKKNSVFLATSQFCFKTTTIVKKFLCLSVSILYTAEKKKLVAAITRGQFLVGTEEVHTKESISLLTFFVEQIF